ncbi:uncharacterized protein LOC111395325 [Olea europaea var. sylvestris]|uniref:uncharacterized protein LOC111395325 n=1 Tax=Olea europaea var. sylvestris TaxID=158386 RepID=UPI000C1D773B|nr:uncharacterized protein LOC111395325 [Olea europaea var. sylvestris]
MKERRLERIVVPFAVDSTQQEALLMLKKLKSPLIFIPSSSVYRRRRKNRPQPLPPFPLVKDNTLRHSFEHGSYDCNQDMQITEDDAKPEQLCTRRKYARWFLRTNSQLERSRKHQINSCAALSGSTVTAFDDVTAQDPDFESIQSLAEAGIIRSKLSGKSSRTSLSDLDGEGCMNFCPDRFVSRQDLISWKVNVEYEVRPGITEEVGKQLQLITFQVSMKNIGFLDVREISSDVLVELFLHILFEEKSILKRVFGQSKRFQLRKPCTKAQAAVALASGRSMEFIHAEISRLEAENSSRETEIEEIKSELLETCEIK